MRSAACPPFAVKTFDSKNGGHGGQRIRMWRTERKISRVTLGEALGLTVQQIQKYESGTNRIGASRLQRICAVLEIPVSSLFEGAPGSLPFEGGMSQDVIDFMASEEGVRVVAAFSRIADRKVRRGIVRVDGRDKPGHDENRYFRHWPRVSLRSPRLRLFCRRWRLQVWWGRGGFGLTDVESVLAEVDHR